jgi:hypothetical protein
MIKFVIYCMILMSLIDSSYDNCVGDFAVVDTIDAVGTEQELENEHIG